MIDAELITRKMVLIARDVAALAPIAAKELSAYLASPTDELVAERYLERIVGRMIDINYHLITEAGQPPPADDYDSFVQLAGLGNLDRDFATRLAGCAGLRNRIAHEYDEIDPAKVPAALPVAMTDIPDYLRRVEAHISGRPR